MKKPHQFLILFIIFTLTLGIRIYWLSQKDGFHVDEGLSVSICCYNEWPNTIGKEYTGKEAKEAALCDNGSLRNALGDVYRLWNNNRDPPHTNLYYSFFRLSLAGLQTGDIKRIIFRGGILNLLFFTLSFVFFFLLMKLLFPDSKLLQFTATLCAFLSTATISNTLFLRPYQIQETLFIILCYWFLKSLKWKKYSVENNTFFISLKSFIGLALLTALTLLTGYYAVMFVGLFGLYEIYVSFRRKDYYEAKFYTAALLLGVVFAQFLYLRYLHGFVSYRAKETSHTLFADILGNLKLSVDSVFTLLNSHFFTEPIIAITLLCLLYLIIRKINVKKLLSQIPALYVFCLSIFYIFIIIFLAPGKTLRYVMPVFPFLVLLPSAIINSIKNKILSIAVMSLLCFCLFLRALNPHNIENINHNKPALYSFAQDVEVPVFVLCNDTWKSADLVPYFNDEQSYYFIGTYTDIENTYTISRFDGTDDIFALPPDELYPKELYLIVEKAILDAQQKDILTQFEVEKEFDTSYFNVKKLRSLGL